MTINLIDAVVKLGKKLSRLLPFSSERYWNSRYMNGGNSGPGSYGKFAEFKAATLNDFVSSNKISTVIEFGCGDGNQLALSKYPSYAGCDISPVAVESCRRKFANDHTKSFFLVSDYDGHTADMSMSLDVIFHLTEDFVFDSYMRRLFDAAKRYVVIYSSNQEESIRPTSKHVRHRHFSPWIEHHRSEWRLLKKIPNPYPYDGDSRTTSFADFYIYEKVRD